MNLLVTRAPIVSNSEKDAYMSDKNFKEEPIAIAGVGGRFAGSATSPEGF
jgi:hypothetical protein